MYKGWRSKVVIGVLKASSSIKGYQGKELLDCEYVYICELPYLIHNGYSSTTNRTSQVFVDDAVPVDELNIQTDYWIKLYDNKIYICMCLGSFISHLIHLSFIASFIS